MNISFQELKKKAPHVNPAFPDSLRKANLTSFGLIDRCHLFSSTKGHVIYVSVYVNLHLQTLK